MKRYPESTLRDKALIGIASTSYYSADYQRAIDLYSELLQQVTDEELVKEVTYKIVWAYRRMGEYQEAARILTTLENTTFLASKISVQEQFQKAETFFLTKDFHNALALFLRVLEEFPQHDLAAKAMYRTGECYVHLNDTQKAVETFTNLSKTYPRSLYAPFAQYHLADNLFQRHYYDGASTAFFEFIMNFPQHPLADDAQYRIGEIMFAQKRLQQAATEFQKVVDVYPTSDLVDDAYYHIGQSLADLERYDEAIAAPDPTGEAIPAKRLCRRRPPVDGRSLFSGAGI